MSVLGRQEVNLRDEFITVLRIKELYRNCSYHIVDMSFNVFLKLPFQSKKKL